MPSFNQVILIGNLTRDVELRHTPSNQTVANIGMAMNRQYQTKDGERREEVTFVDCEAWGRQAEVMAQYLSKGRPVMIQGRLKLDTWQDKEGGNRSKLKVVVENFQFLGSREGGGNAGASGGGGKYQSAGAPSGSSDQGGGSPNAGGPSGSPSESPSESHSGGSHQAVDDSDIPF
ncbi:MAG: single-stranded DNA-binding protein [Phycisphaerales bacterium]|nr:single-stranded DNA-binding protein [Phycisphaerales bacterium]